MDSINFCLEIQPLAEDRLAAGGFWCGPEGGAAFGGWPDALAPYPLVPMPERLRQQIPHGQEPPDPLGQAEQAERFFHRAVLDPAEARGTPFREYGQWLLGSVLLGHAEASLAFDVACGALDRGGAERRRRLRLLLRFTSASGHDRLCDRFQRLTYELAYRESNAGPGPRGFLLEPFAPFHVVLYRAPRQGADTCNRRVAEPDPKAPQRTVVRR